MADATAETSTASTSNIEVQVAPAKRIFDLATILGLVGAAGLIGTAIVLGGSPASFVNLQSILIVFGGTFAVTTICYTFGDIFRTFGIIAGSMFRTVRKPKDAAIQVLQLSFQARRNGVLSIQGILDNLGREPFLHKGISMVVDGVPAKEVIGILTRDLESTLNRSDTTVGVLRKAGEFAPAMGLIGTLIGLVQMLGNLDDPSTIGPSMAVALLTTFYGALLANLVFLPLAAKLEGNTSSQETISNLYLLGISSISRQENPRRLEMLLNSSLPPSDQVRFFE